MAATSALLKRIAHWRRVLRRLATAPRRNVRPVAGLVGSALAVGGAAEAVTLPEDKAEAMYHVYDGGGVRATGPALLVRKSLVDKVSLSAGYYVDSVSNASIDVVTTASPFKETRDQVDLGLDHVYRDTKMSVGLSRSKEPEYTASTLSVDAAQEVFGGMSTVSLGFSRGSDDVGKDDSPEFADTAKHWQYRIGLTQILSPRWLMSLNAEAISDEGFLGSPYRVARVFGAAVPERNPRTRTGRAIKARVIGDLGSRDAMRAEYRYYWDTWDIKAHTVELGYSRYFGDPWLADAYVRWYSQDKALFYSDNATAQTTYVSRNRQLSTFNSIGLGGKLSYTFTRVAGKYDVKANLGYELKRFSFSDFTDIRTGDKYSFHANVLQLFVTANY